MIDSDVTEQELQTAIKVVARAITKTGEPTLVPVLERLEAELARMQNARDGVSRARQIIGGKG